MVQAILNETSTTFETVCNTHGIQGILVRYITNLNGTDTKLQFFFVSYLEGSNGVDGNEKGKCYKKRYVTNFKLTEKYTKNNGSLPWWFKKL